MQTFLRTLQFTGFTLLEYLRSARILIELIAMLAFFFVFLRRWGQGIDAQYFFTVTGVFTLVLTLYTNSAIIGLGDRPQSYIILARRVSRSSYLIGLYLTTVAIIAGIYGLICIGTAVYNPPIDLDMTGWALGTLPLLLNVGIMSALLLMLSPLVFPSGWRLFILGLIAVAFSSNFIGGPMLQSLPSIAERILRSAQTILSWPLVPAFRGFALALSRNYSGPALLVIAAQISLLIAILGLALYAFARRDLIFSTQ
jgi:hypothetical protein